jgi:serine/threonine-protein kinase HipA
MLGLTPAYDICPQSRTGNEATQAMLIPGDDRMSRISSCLNAAPQFLLSLAEAIAIVEHQLTRIIEHWDAVCTEADLTAIDRAFLWGRQFPQPLCL